MSLTIRSIEQNDMNDCGRIGYEAHKFISSIHGYPSEQPSEEYGIALIRSLLNNPNSWGALAERQGKMLGSIFLHRFPPSPVAVIGPLTVHPSAEGGGIVRILIHIMLRYAQFATTMIFQYCNELCKSSYGFSREMELHQVKDQGVAF